MSVIHCGNTEMRPSDITNRLESMSVIDSENNSSGMEIEFKVKQQQITAFRRVFLVYYYSYRAMFLLLYSSILTIVEVFKPYF